MGEGTRQGSNSIWNPEGTRNPIACGKGVEFDCVEGGLYCLRRGRLVSLSLAKELGDLEGRPYINGDGFTSGFFAE